MTVLFETKASKLTLTMSHCLRQRHDFTGWWWAMVRKGRDKGENCEKMERKGVETGIGRQEKLRFSILVSLSKNN